MDPTLAVNGRMFPRRLTERDWSNLKPLIKRLYLDEGRPLPIVLSVLRHQGYEATDRMVRLRLRRWNYLKRDHNPATPLDSFQPSGSLENGINSGPSRALDPTFDPFGRRHPLSHEHEVLSTPNDHDWNNLDFPLDDADVDHDTTMPQTDDFESQNDVEASYDQPSVLLNHHKASDNNVSREDLYIDSMTNFLLKLSLGSSRGPNPLHQAAQNGHLPLVTELSHQYDINALDANGVTALWLAAEKGHSEIVKHLLSLDADPSIKARGSGRLALHQAALNGHLDITHYLLLKMAREDIDLPGSDGETPLLLAAQSGDSVLVSLLLRWGANIEGSTFSATCPIHQAAQEGHSEIVSILLSEGAEKDPVTKEGFTPLWLAAKHGDAKSVRMLLRQGANPNIAAGEKRYQPLHLATKNKDIYMIRELLEAMTDVDVPAANNTTALWHAASRCQRKVVSLLLERNVNLEVAHRKSGRRPLHQVAQAGDFELLKLLLSKGAKIDAEEEDGATPLWLAAQDGELQIVEELLRAGANPDVRSKETKRQAIHQAAQNGHSKVVSLLLAKNCRFNDQTSDGVTPLWLAAQKGDRRSVEALLRAGSDPNISSHDRYSPLHLASQSCNPEIVRMLLDHKADPDVVSMDGRTPLCVSALKGDTKSVEMLLLKGSNPNQRMWSQQQSPLHVAAIRGFDDIVTLLILHGADVDAKNAELKTPLLYAAEKGRYTTVLKLIHKNADPEIKSHSGRVALHYTAQNGFTEIVKALGTIMKDMDPKDDQYITPLFLAAANGNEQITSFLLAHGADTNTLLGTYDTPLHYAVDTGNEKIVALLLNNGADPNHQNARGVTPLFTAAQGGRLKVIETLLGANANPNALDAEEGRHPLHQAAQSSHSAVVSLLLKAGCSADQFDHHGNTPLCVASHSGDTTSVAELLEHDASPNVSSNRKLRSPLHNAARRGHLEVVRLLLKQKADIDATDRSGATPLIIAARKGYLEVVKLLREKGADPNVQMAKDDSQALHRAIEKGHYDVARFLIPQMENVDVAMTDGRTPLWLACQVGDNRIVGELLERKADPNVFAQKTRRRAIHEASANGNLEITKALLALIPGGDVDVTDADGMTPLLLSLERRDFAANIAEAILDAGANPNLATVWSTKRPLHAAAEYGNAEMISKMIEKGAEVDVQTEKGETPLLLAAQKGARAAVRTLLHSGANPDRGTSTGLRPLHVAAKGGHTDIVGILLSKTSEINAETDDGETPLSLAIAAGDSESVIELLAIGANLNVQDKATGYRALHSAAKIGVPQMLETLLEKGAHINEAAEKGLTPLHLASQNNRIAAVELLIRHGADITIRDASGMDAFTHAATNGHGNILKLLSNARARLLDSL